MNIEVKKITKGSLFKLLFVGGLFGFFFLFIACGIAAYFGAETISVNGENVTGFKGLTSAIIMWPFFSAAFAGFMWLFMAFGLWIYSLFKPLKLSFVASQNE